MLHIHEYWSNPRETREQRASEYTQSFLGVPEGANADLIHELTFRYPVSGEQADQVIKPFVVSLFESAGFDVIYPTGRGNEKFQSSEYNAHIITKLNIRGDDFYTEDKMTSLFREAHTLFARSKIIDPSSNKIPPQTERELRELFRHEGTFMQDLKRSPSRKKYCMWIGSGRDF